MPERDPVQAMEAGADQRFAWPPAKPVSEVVITRGECPGEAGTAEVIPPEIGPNLTRVLSRRSPGWLAEVERTWLDIHAAPLAERMAEAGWRPLGVNQYCRRCGSMFDKAKWIQDASGKCKACDGTRPSWHRMICLGAYREPLRRWVHEVKYTRWRRLGEDLGNLLGAAVRDEMERVASVPGLIGAKMDVDEREVLSRPPVVVPMPMTLRRLMLRGIDHAKAIGRGVAGEVGGVVIQPLKRKHRPSQTEVSPSGRATNVSRAIERRAWWVDGVRPRRRKHGVYDGRLVIVVDDVSTTGSTLRSACRVLREELVDTRRSLLWVAVVGKAEAKDMESAGVSDDRPNA